MTVEEYAKQNNVTEKRAYDLVKERNLLEVNIAHKTPKLVYDKSILKKGYVISTLNLKGGCGKTTLTVHISILLSKLGFKVLLVDSDHQNQCQFFFPEQQYNFDLTHVLSNEKLINECIYKNIQTETSELDILFSSNEVALFASKLKDQNQLANKLSEIKSQYDFICIDTAPSFDIVNINVANASDFIIIPSSPSRLHAEGMTHNFKALQQVAKINLDKIIGIVPSIVNLAKAQHRAYMKLFLKEFANTTIDENIENEKTAIENAYLKISKDINYSGLLFGSFIPESTPLSNVTDENSNVFDRYEKSNGSQALKKLTWEILRRM